MRTNNHNINLTIHLDEEAIQLLRSIFSQGSVILATLDDVAAEVEATSGVVDSAVNLLTSLHDQLAEAIASNDPAAVQAIVDSLDATKQKLADAVAANA